MVTQCPVVPQWGKTQKEDVVVGGDNVLGFPAEDLRQTSVVVDLVGVPSKGLIEVYVQVFNGS